MGSQAIRAALTARRPCPCASARLNAYCAELPATSAGFSSGRRAAHTLHFDCALQVMHGLAVGVYSHRSRRCRFAVLAGLLQVIWIRGIGVVLSQLSRVLFNAPPVDPLQSTRHLLVNANSPRWANDDLFANAVVAARQD
jgi:hypothetical protein